MRDEDFGLVLTINRVDEKRILFPESVKKLSLGFDDFSDKYAKVFS
ncbi:MAG: hypothetical protein KAJ29_07910 [Alphaproteobacteria bacterium]|nr:hypothetical protein [Alphaproteobacteria bacterium]